MPLYISDMGSQNPVDIAKLAASGQCAGLIHRATRSNEKLDPLYHSRREVWRATGAPFGGYAFNTGEPAAVQVKRFLDYAKFEDDESAWLDLERNPSGTGTMTLPLWLEFLDRSDQEMGRYCGTYGGDVVKSLIVRATETQREFLAKHPLWGCEYGPRWKHIDANGRALPWAKPLFWQYAADGEGPEPQTLPGLEDGADLSVFDGTAAELKAVWAGAAIPAPAVA